MYIEHDYVSDRVWRTYYDRVGAVVVYRTIPVARILLVLVLLVTPGLLLQLVDEPVASTIGWCLVAAAVAMLTWSFICGKTHIMIERDGTWRTYLAIATPGRMRRFLDELYQRIRAAQPPVEVAAEMPEGVTDLSASAPSGRDQHNAPDAPSP